MKKNIKLSVAIATSLLAGAAYAATDELKIDTFKLDVCSDHIVGRLWRGEDVPDTEIDEMLSSFSSSSENSDASISEEDEEGSDSLHRKRTKSKVDDFEELMEEIAHDRQKEAANIHSFMEKMRSQEARKGPLVIEQALNVIIEKY